MKKLNNNMRYLFLMYNNTNYIWNTERLIVYVYFNNSDIMETYEPFKLCSNLLKNNNLNIVMDISTLCKGDNLFDYKKFNTIINNIITFNL